MSEPPIDERYELAAVKESLTADERKAAEHAYTVSAFDYEKAPVGSRDWTLFWSGWCARATQPSKAQPPCGTDGAALAALAALVTRDLCESEPANPDDPDTVCVHVDYVGEVIRRHYAGTGGASRALDLLTQSALDHYTPHMVCIPAEKWAEAMALLNANKSAPATAVPDGWGIYRAYGSKGELLLVHNEQKAVATSIDENNPAYGILHAMLAAQPAAPVAQSERFRGLADRLRKANKPGKGIRPGQFLSAPQILSVPQKGDHHDGPVSTTVWLHTDECAKQDGSVCICNPESTNAAPVAPATVAVPEGVDLRVITAECELAEGGLYVIRALPHVDDPEFAKGKLQYFTRKPDHLGRLRLWKHFNGNYEALAVTLPEFPAMLAASQRDQRALASQQPAAQGADEIGWLVENGKDGSELRYRTWKDGLPAWTRDHNEATRYCRRIDAEKAHAEDVDGWRVVEHMWPSVPSRRPTGAAP